MTSTTTEALKARILAGGLFEGEPPQRNPLAPGESAGSLRVKYDTITLRKAADGDAIVAEFAYCGEVLMLLRCPGASFTAGETLSIENLRGDQAIYLSKP